MQVQDIIQKRAHTSECRENFITKTESVLYSVSVFSRKCALTLTHFVTVSSQVDKFFDWKSLSFTVYRISKITLILNSNNCILKGDSTIEEAHLIRQHHFLIHDSIIVNRKMHEHVACQLYLLKNPLWSQCLDLQAPLSDVQFKDQTKQCLSWCCPRLVDHAVPQLVKHNLLSWIIPLNGIYKRTLEKKTFALNTFSHQKTLMIGN